MAALAFCSHWHAPSGLAVLPSLRLALPAVAAAALWLRAGANFYKHELVDGEVREIACDSLDDCFLKGVSTPGMLLHRTWNTEIHAALDRRAIHAVRPNKSSLHSRQAQVRELLRRRLLPSGLPRAAPRARQVRRFVDEARGVSVTLLLFESRPRHAVPAVLFAPIGAEARPRGTWPAVLHLPGHLAPGLRDPAEQRLSLGLAQRGFAVLTFDPLSQGERRQYREDTGLECGAAPGGPGGDCQSLGPPCSTAHDHFGKQLWLLGRSAAELFLEDARRALDFLSALTWVDPSRVGAMGCSGGGMLTAYLAATDHRIRAAAVGCYFSTLGQELEAGTCNYDAEQILWGQAQLGLDKPDLLIARAPRPTVVLLTSHDCFPIRGGQDGLQEVTPSFQAHGPNDRGEIGLFASESGGYHGVTDVGLEVTFQVFQDYLLPPRVPRPQDTSPLQCDRLWFGREELAAGVGQGPAARVGDLLRGFAAPLRRRLRARRRAAPGRLLRALPALSAQVAGLDVPRALAEGSARALPLTKARWFTGGVEEWYVLPTVHQCAVTLRLFRFAGAEEQLRPGAELPPGARLALLAGGPVELNRELSAFESSALLRLQTDGVHVAFVGLCGVGDDMWRGGLWEFAPLLVARTHVGFHAEELIRSIRWAREALGASRVAVAASGGGAGAALLHALPHVAGGPGGALGRVAFLREHLAFEDVALAPRHRLPWLAQMHGVLEHYDLPDLLALLAGRRGGPQAALVACPLAASGRPLRRRRALAALALARRRFAAVGRRLRLVADDCVARPSEFDSQQEAKIVAEFLSASQ